MQAILEKPNAPQAGPDFWSIAIFVLMATTGLYYVKWHPSYAKALFATTGHFRGVSIITGRGAAPPPPSWEAAWGYARAYGKDIWQALLLGLILGTGVQTLLPTQAVRRFLSSPTYAGVAKGGLISIPSMMCTCCAAPVAVGLLEAGASVGAALAYWLGNPLLNPATLVLTQFLLGWRWTVIRIAAGLGLVFGVSYLADRFVNPVQLGSMEALAPVDSPESRDAGRLWFRWMREFWRLSVRIIPEYAILVLLLGAARAWLFPLAKPGVAEGLPWVLGMAFAGTLFVIPTAGEIAIVQSMMALGLNVAPAAALLVTLPALSLPSLAMVMKAFRFNVLLFVTCAVIAAGVLAGLASVLLFT